MKNYIISAVVVIVTLVCGIVFLKVFNEDGVKLPVNTDEVISDVVGEMSGESEVIKSGEIEEVEQESGEDYIIENEDEETEDSIENTRVGLPYKQVKLIKEFDCEIKNKLDKELADAAWEYLETCEYDDDLYEKEGYYKRYDYERKILLCDEDISGDNLKLYELYITEDHLRRSYYELVFNDIVVYDELRGSFELELIDLNDEDEYVEIAINHHDENFLSSSVYRIADGKLIDMGDSITYRYFRNLIYLDNKYFVKSYPFKEETVAFEYLLLENNKMTYKTLTYDEVKDKVYTVTEETLEAMHGYTNIYDLEGNLLWKDWEREDLQLKVGDKIKLLPINGDSFYWYTDGHCIKFEHENGYIYINVYASNT